MIEKIQNYARQEIKEGLAKLPESNQRLFKQMYAGGHLDKDINQVVDDMAEEKLNHALRQVENTLAKQAREK